MTSRDSTQVRPAETDGWEQGKEKKAKETINLFEVLEDRYAYEGFNKFICHLALFFITYQWLLCIVNWSDVAGHKNILKHKIVPSSFEQLERNEFNSWSYKIMKEVINDNEYFGDEFRLMRITAWISPTLCNHTKQHPRKQQFSLASSYV